MYLCTHVWGVRVCVCVCVHMRTKDRGQKTSLHMFPEGSDSPLSVVLSPGSTDFTWAARKAH